MELTAAGNAQNSLKIKDSPYGSIFKDNRAVMGGGVSLKYDKGLLVEEAVVKFKMNGSYAKPTGSIYEQRDEGIRGIKRYQIFRYDSENNVLIPVKTEFDEAAGVLYAATTKFGEYCVIDLEKWLYGLGIEFEPGEENGQTAAAATFQASANFAEISGEVTTGGAFGVEEDEGSSREIEPLPWEILYPIP